MDEIARLTPSYAGVSYDRLEGFNSLQWPVDKDGKRFSNSLFRWI